MDFQTKLQPQPVCYCHTPHYTASSSPAKYAFPCLTFIFMLLVVMVAVILIGPSILVAMHHPSTPVISLTWVEFHGLNLSPSTSRITAGSATIQFRIENRNSKSTVAYEKIRVNISYRGYLLKQTPVQSFYQGAKAETEVVAEVQAMVEKAIDRDVLYDMEQELVTTGSLQGFAAELGTRVWYEPGSSGILGWGWQNTWATCKGFRIGFSANRTDGSLSSGPKECSVKGSF